MASYGDGGENVCLKAEYPAASIFKIISAAAALERAGMNPDSRVSYHGRKHTLYRKQLKEKEEAYASQISLSEAFAGSINPVFGKLGIYRLGKGLLAEYADRFYFNRPIPFDARVETSIAEVPGEDFGLAEVASGFNKRTLMSPLHAALLAAAAVNDGVMMAPRLIERVKGDSGNVVYASRPEQLAAPITRATAKELRTLMEDTVTSGTCRKSLKPLLRKQRLKNIELGAKTGTINDREDKYKYDWLVAYAIPPRPREAICICVMGVHGKRLGIRAGNLGGLIIARYLGT
jgi:cell division protein FtsI/penicillin-binding protein 2